MTENVQTLAALARSGYNIIKGKDVIEMSKSDLQALKKTCITLPSHELSRARGGPRCMSMPLVRACP